MMRNLYLFTIAILLLVVSNNSVIGDDIFVPLANSTDKVTTVKNDSNPNITSTLSNGEGNFTVITNLTSTRKFVLKPTFTRTELKVSRSLNPESMQTLNVRTNNGGVATILVKKRDGKKSGNSEVRPMFYDVSNQYSRGEVRKGIFGPVQVLERISEPQRQYHYPKAVYGNWAAIPPTKLYHRTPNEAYRFASHSPDDTKSINLINSFMKHVEMIEGRNKQFSVSDDNIDRRSVPIPTTRIHDNKVPDPVVIRSDNVFVKQQPDASKAKRGKSLMEISEDGIPLIHGVREPDDENDKKQTWRNARVINGELVPYEKGYTPPRTLEYGELIYPIKRSPSPASKRKSIGPFSTTDNFSQENSEQKEGIGPFSVKDNLFSSRNVHLRNSGSSIGPFSVADNSRLSNAKLIDYIKRINDQELRKDYFVGTRNVNFPDEQPKIQRRMLTQIGNQDFPISSKYTYSKADDSEVESMNGPVLQYAHPEFGVQAAKVGTAYEDSQSKSINKNFESTENKNGKIEYYTKPQNRPQPHPMYRVDPASLNTREVYSFPPQTYHMKTPPATYPYNYGFIRRVRPEKPFWMKIQDGMRNSIAQVQEFTRPVIEPIMEAGHKISTNLGFSQPKPEDRVAQEKVGIISSSGTSIILPAIGIVAGGAALGLGALGWRIFDYANLGSLLQRSDDDLLNMEHKRALDAIHQIPTTTLYLVENDSNDDTKRYRRNPKDRVSSTSSSSSHVSDNNNFLELIAIPFSTTSQTKSISSSEISPGETVRRSKRTRRSIGVAIDDSLGSILQDIQKDVPKSYKVGFEQQIKNTDWSNTPCAKKTFCQVMIHQHTHDEILFMEKRMFTLLEIMHPALRTSLAHHLSEVTEAIRRYDCSKFECYQN